MEFTSSHKYIKNTSANETNLTEHMLNTSRGLWATKSIRKIPTQLGKMKERKKRTQKRDQQCWQESESEESFPHSEKPPHGADIS